MIGTMSMAVTVTVLMEDRLGGNSALKSEHGLSLFIRSPGGSILFDTGGSDLFLGNAPFLGIDPFGADHLVLSHGHYDHTGGVIPFYQAMAARFPGREKGIPLWCGRGFFTPKYSSTETDGLFYYNGNPFTRENLLSMGISVREVGEGSFWRREILPGVYLVGGFDRKVEGDVVTPRFMIPDSHAETGFSRDPFNDEVSLVLEAGQDRELIMVAGCSHPGIANMVSTVARGFGRAPSVLLGGSHLLHADADRLKGVVDLFRKSGLRRIGLNHCTGKEMEEHLGAELPGFFSLRCGASFAYPRWEAHPRQDGHLHGGG